MVHFMHRAASIHPGDPMAYHATTKTEANKATKRRRIIEVTQRKIATAGFAGVSMADIAQEADIATGTLYRYFSSKQALCTEVFKIYTEVEVRIAQGLTTEPGKSPTKKLATAIEAFARRAIKSQHLAWSLIAEPLDPALESERLRYRGAYRDIYKRLIDEGVEQGEFRPQMSEVSAAAIVGALAESLLGPLSLLSRQSGSSSSTPVDTDLIVNNITLFCLSSVGKSNGT